jgi:transposase
MAVVDGQGTPIGLLVESANPSEIKLAEPTLATVRVSRPNRKPKSRPKELVADKGYDSKSFRQRLRSRGIKPCIPYRDFGHLRVGRKPDLTGYSERWHVERTFGWLESFRKLLTRFERLVKVYMGFLYLAVSLICIRRLVSG